eukprot:TRINITY_DN58733_c0_g1_i1.p1 TRINITY_DN58733_c0_g1~~TRINITY_DN58733_c0_g1_i1.p1  ORF type:complete len:220 (+),score=28.63 TRINITY_DN58733_c0_g1_i1:156-815(+)
MLNFQRFGKGSFRDVLSVSACTVEEAQQVLRNEGFIPCDDEQQLGDSDEEDGSLWPPLPGRAGGGGVRSSSLRGAFLAKVWSVEQDSGNAVGFYCAQDIAKRVIYAHLAEKGQCNEERYLKRAITCLFDVAEAGAFRRITVGLDPEHAANPEFVCSMLHLGFQVVPPRKMPMANLALVLEFHTGIQHASTSSDTYTGTSDCSTSLEDNLLESESYTDRD